MEEVFIKIGDPVAIKEPGHRYHEHIGEVVAHYPAIESVGIKFTQRLGNGRTMEETVVVNRRMVVEAPPQEPLREG